MMAVTMSANPGTTSGASGPGARVTSVATNGRPVAGDLEVTSQTNGRASFTIRQVPDTPGLQCDSRDTAVAIARGFAAEHRVDVWMNDGRVAELLYSRRPARGGRGSLPSV